MLFAIVFSSLIIQSICDHQFILYNHCPFTVWAGTLGNTGLPAPIGGGDAILQYTTKSFTVSDGWGGRIWGRTECGTNGPCVTGDCGNNMFPKCNYNAGGVPPVTLAEFTLDGWGGIDYYDVSLVDGYNLPMQIAPNSGTYVVRNSGDIYDCGTAGCYKDLNAICPQELRVYNPSGWPVACMSACMKFNTDQYCCRGSYGTPQTCNSNSWPTNYPAIFKNACPKAYSYAYDDTTSTFTCKGNPKTGYTITFCP